MVKLYDIVDIRRDLGNFSFLFCFSDMLKTWGQPLCLLPLTDTRESRLIYNIYVFVSVDADEIKRLGKRFRKLDLDNSGSLSVDEFMTLPELQQNPLVQRVIDIFDTDGNGEVDFKGKNNVFISFTIKIKNLNTNEFRTYSSVF
jgi:hypothetical protein